MRTNYVERFISTNNMQIKGTYFKFFLVDFGIRVFILLQDFAQT